ncbi:hypothetical protein E3Q13_03818 [Wallemia mellicola]|nr:hypothetical protein E3Q13_03818 [Wallemia mellicola]
MFKCDGCRRKKVKCDGIYPDKCSICKHIECTYESTEPKKYYNINYVNKLEQELAQLRNITNNNTPSTSSNVQYYSPIETIPSNDWEDLQDDQVAKDIDGLYIPGDMSGKRYYGKASMRGLFERVFLYTNLDPQTLLKGKRPEFWVEDWIEELNRSHSSDSLYTQDENMINHLIDIYFNRVNRTLPLLDETHFKNSIPFRRLEEGFSRLLSLVCALGAMFSDDTRVLVPGKEHLRFLAGFSFYEKVRLNLPDFTFKTTSLEDIQTLILLQVYIQKGAQSKNTWMVHGLTLLLVQNRGLHLSWLSEHENPIEKELGKRATWMLYILDRAHTACFGRPTLMKDDDMCLQYPSAISPNECPDNDINLVYIKEYLKLCKIHGEVIQQLYKFRKSNRGEDLIVTVNDIASLNAKLHQWLKEVHPTFSIRNTENDSDDTIFQLKSNLRVLFNNIQIFMYKPFLPRPDHSSSKFQLKSLMICANAARSVITTFANVYLDRKIAYQWNDCMTDWSVFSATIILVLSCCESRINGELYESDLDYLKKGALILRNQEHRNQLYARAFDLLIQVLKASELLSDDTFVETQESISTGRTLGINVKDQLEQNDEIVEDMLKSIRGNSNDTLIGLNDFNLPPLNGIIIDSILNGSAFN